MPNILIQRKIGERIKALRRSHGWNQEELARRAGQRRTHLSQVETGAVDVRIGTLQEIAKAFRLPLSELLKDVDDV